MNPKTSRKSMTLVTGFMLAALLCGASATRSWAEPPKHETFVALPKFHVGQAGRGIWLSDLRGARYGVEVWTTHPLTMDCKEQRYVGGELVHETKASGSVFLYGGQDYGFLFCDSLDEKSWIDDSHLKDEKGNPVFNEYYTRKQVSFYRQQRAEIKEDDQIHSCIMEQLEEIERLEADPKVMEILRGPGKFGVNNLEIVVEDNYSNSATPEAEHFRRYRTHKSDGSFKIGIDITSTSSPHAAQHTTLNLHVLVDRYGRCVKNYASVDNPGDVGPSRASMRTTILEWENARQKTALSPTFEQRLDKAGGALGSGRTGAF